MPDNYGENNVKLPEELQKALISLVQKYEKEDQDARQKQLRQWKKNDLFWHGIQHIFWSETENDWRNPSEAGLATDAFDEEDIPFYDFVINIYKAHGESVIAALSAQVPTVRFPPDDPDNEDDRLASKTYNKIADLIARHNNAKLIMLQALFILWNQGLIASYCCPKTSSKYGQVSVPKLGEVNACPECGQVPEDEKATACPTCMDEMGMPVPLQARESVVGVEEHDKTRILLEQFGPVNVKIKRRACKQDDLPYLLLMYEQPLGKMRAMYPEIAEKIGRSQEDTQEKEARDPFDGGSSCDDVVMKRAWLRPWTLEELTEDHRDSKEALQKLFPEGIYVCLIGENYAESRNEDLDDFWQVGKAGLSRFIHSDPLGQPLIPIQELRNLHTNLTEETVEHSIPSGFADPEVLDFDAYKKEEVRPGTMFPAAVKAGERLADKFFETGKASLSREVEVFAERLDSDGQFVVGSFPSIYGGPSETGSRTASEYTQSRQNALQRLSNTWFLLVDWWAHLMEKAVKRYIDNMVGDERYTVPEGKGYKSVYISLMAAKNGKVGEVEPEGSDRFPITLAQQQDLIIKILEMQNEDFNTALTDPQNRKMIADTFGFTRLFIPGEDQRSKQAREIQEIIKGELVEVEPDIDEHEIHMSELRSFLVSDVGLDLRKGDPEAYMRLKAHLEQHKMLAMEQMISEAQAPPEEQVQQ